jgi:pilus assembly protein CpaF
MELPLLAVREQIASAVHLIVQQARYACGTRRIVVISEVTGTESGRIQMQDIFRFEQAITTPAGTTSGRFLACGNEPAFYERLPREMRPPPLCPEGPC